MSHFILKQTLKLCTPLRVYAKTTVPGDVALTRLGTSLRQCLPQYSIGLLIFRIVCGMKP